MKPAKELQNEPGSIKDPCLGRLLAASREDCGLHQKEIEAESGPSLRTIASLERKGEATAKSLKLYIRALSVLRKRSGRKGVALVKQGITWALKEEEPTWLSFPDKEWLAELHGPSALLTADYRVVHFHGPNSLKELDRLMAWSSTAERFAVRIYKGQAGIGKTRLAIELCQALRNLPKEQWTTGFARREHFPTVTSPYIVLGDLSGPLLIVVDYAGEQENTFIVGQLLRHLHTCPAQKVRLVFLERNELWLDRLHGGAALRDIIHGPLFSKTQGLEVHKVPAVADPGKERAQSFGKALKCFSAKLGIQPEAITPPALLGPLYESILYVHMNALLAGLGHPVQGKERILLHILAREREYWSKRLKAKSLPPHLLEAVEQSLLVFSTHGSVRNISEGIELLKTSNELKGYPEIDLRNICKILQECYPQGDRGIGALQPDELKDYLISTLT